MDLLLPEEPRRPLRANLHAARRMAGDARAALARRPFLKNVSIMLTGAVAGQSVSILLSPVLTRLFSPQQFGILSVYTAILTIIVVVASLRLEMTLPLAATDEEAVNLAAVCGAALVVMTGVLAVCAFLFPMAWARLIWPTALSAFRVRIYCGLLVLGFFCLGGYFIALYLATRQSAFRAIANTRIAQGVVGPVSQIGMGLLQTGAHGLVLGSILGQSAGTFGLLRNVLHGRRELLRAISWRRMLELARRYRRFPLIASWAALLDAAGGNQLLYLLVSVEYSARIAGFIFLAERIVSRPLSLIGTSILQVFIGEAGKTVSSDPGKLKARFYQVTTRQFLIAAVWILAANIFAAALFPLVFGARWSQGVIYLEAMSLGYLVQAVVLPVFHTLQLMEKQSLAAAWQVGRLVSVAVVFACCLHGNLSPPWTIFCYSATQAVSGIVLFVLIARSIQSVQR
jgi:O-antigen/teichoic acid export membrane protein